ncbi:unnamed protein product [Prorocentrum cordatum]|uniref:Uncharacterized protein n=1 Tax=Prorocentrum cordatum TaxID=2364126 RepID=A0ABN9UF18_9DINO|nr:unnamed protein product [Polarella glacialis]
MKLLPLLPARALRTLLETALCSALVGFSLALERLLAENHFDLFEIISSGRNTEAASSEARVTLSFSASAVTAKMNDCRSSVFLLPMSGEQMTLISKPWEKPLKQHFLYPLWRTFWLSSIQRLAKLTSSLTFSGLEDGLAVKLINSGLVGRRDQFWITTSVSSQSGMYVCL